MNPEKLREQTDYGSDIKFHEVTIKLKSEINEFLFCRLPDHCSIKELDDLSLEIHDKILEKWNKIEVSK